MPTSTLLHDLQASATTQLVEALVASERRMRQRIELLAEIVFELDTSGGVLFLNKACERLTGIPASALLGRSLGQLVMPEDQPLFEGALQGAERTLEPRPRVMRILHANGSALWVELSLARIEDGFVGALHDITQQKRIQDQLEVVAHFDVLTRLPNRVLLSDRIGQAMTACRRHNQSMAVAFLDLDGFKAINDRLGHDAGDQLLVTLSRRLKSNLREGDSIARIGGDEFVIVLVELDRAQQCRPALDRLLGACAEPVQLGATQVQVSASVGVTIYPMDEGDAEQLVRHADRAMYAAKQAGKNRIQFYDVAYESAVRTHGESLGRIEQGVDRDEFLLHFQPKVDLRSGRVVGVEALIRWQHPERGLLEPSAFLPTTKNHPVSVQLGEWVIARALEQSARWRSAGLDLEISVNIDAFHLQDEHFVQRITAILSQHPLARSQPLSFEILETSELENTEQVARVIQACQSLGISFALDDFGTGYSSLTYLKQLPAETLKIDRSFVRDMLIDQGDLSIVKGVIALAEAFGRQVIAEGVETLAHVERLRELGCHLAQGYGIARPMPAEALHQWVQDRQPGAPDTRPWH
ncbi:MAG: EAL domain-containing protein [Rhodoferax sp.]|nr:EAL domain-containing protein [Rhodoferax sp.]